MAQGKKENVPFERTNSDFKPKTDLHTHFVGAMQSKTLIKIGVENKVKYPAALLKQMNIDTSKYIENPGKNSRIPMDKMDEADLKIMEKCLSLPIVTQETFPNMEHIYTYRNQITRYKNLFPIVLREIAKEYKKMGIEYAELSFSDFFDHLDILKQMEEVIPEIEKEIGVKIRFIAAFSRHAAKELRMDRIDQLKFLLKSNYIVGCDFMGHETNSTLDFEEELRTLARYSMLYNPGFVIRVHAGENPIYKANVYDTLKTIYDEHEKIVSEYKKEFPMPNVRIGHGLYGIDITRDGKNNEVSSKDVLELAKKMNAIIEFNMSSNISLNNINSILDVPIKRYLDAGVQVVLGTDGHGLYSTSPEMFVR